MLRSPRKPGPSEITLADQAGRAGQWEIAAQRYRAVLARNPRNAPIWVQYGHALKESGKHAAAEAAYRRAIEDDPDGADCYLQLGHVLKLMGRIEEAKAAYAGALTIDRSLTDAAAELAALGGSMQDASRLANRPGTPPRAHAKLSIISRADRARELAEWHLASRLYRKALMRNSARPEIWIQYGHVLKETGRLAQAETAYRRALSYQPKFADAHRQLGVVLKLQGRVQEATSAFLRAFALEPAAFGDFSDLRSLSWPEAEVTALQRLRNGEPQRSGVRMRDPAELDRSEYPSSVPAGFSTARPRPSAAGKPKLAFICEAQYFKVHFWNDLDDLFEVSLFPMQFGQPTEFFQPLIDYDADYNFFFRGEFLPDGLLDQLRGCKINWSSEPFPKLVNGRLHATADSFNRLETFLQIQRHPFDYVFHYDESSASVLRRLGCRLSGFPALPIATESLSRHSLLPKAFPSVDAEFDIFFVGRATPHRERYFTALKHSLRFLHIESGIFGAELLPLVRNSKIAVNVHAEDFLGWEPRVQQLLASECFVISEPISPNPYILPGEHFIEAATPEAFAEKCREFLHADEQRRRIARAGWRQVREVLAAKQVFPALLDQINSGMLPKPFFRIDAAALKALSYFAKFKEFDHIEEFFTTFAELID